MSIHQKASIDLPMHVSIDDASRISIDDSIGVSIDTILASFKRVVEYSSLENLPSQLSLVPSRILSSEKIDPRILSLYSCIG